MNAQPSGMDDNPSLFPVFGRLPDDLKDIVCDQVEEFLQQASFLRRADHFQAYLVHTRGVRLSTPEEQIEIKAVEGDETISDPGVVEELSVVQALTTKLPPVLEQDVAESFDDEQACKPQAVHRWFEDRNQALSKASSRARKRFSTASVTSVSMRGNAVLRSVAPLAEGMHHLQTMTEVTCHLQNCPVLLLMQQFAYCQTAPESIDIHVREQCGPLACFVAVVLLIRNSRVADGGVHDVSSALAACLSPMTALETSMKLMSLLQSDDPRQPALKDNSASRAFALVTKCPSIMLQSMLLKSVINTSGMQLTALDRTDIYTVVAQWLQVCTLYLTSV